jgi:hypothetical protein
MATAVRARAYDSDSIEHAPPAERVRRRAPRAATIAALAFSAIVAGTAAAARTPLVVATGTAAGELHLSRAYVALAPLCDVYDTLTLLTISQHAALLAWVLASFVAWRTWRRVRGVRRVAAVQRVAREGIALLGAFGAALAFYAAGALLPRPMASLVLADADDLAVDVHSHTEASHDGRPRFDAEANRRWHAAAGFNAVYVTDHRAYEGAEAGVRANPATAGDGVVLLPGIESRYGGEHVTVLGATAVDSLDQRGKLDVARLARLSAADDGSVPRLIAVLTIPARLGNLPAKLRVDAIELSDGAPRGLAFSATHGEMLRQLALARGATPVAGSNNHGWGQTAAAWTVVQLPGWRGMEPSALDGAIRGAIARSGSGVRIVERSAPPPPRHIAAWLATPALVGWHMGSHMSAGERWAWLAWIWGVWAAVRVVARRRTRGWLPARTVQLRLEPKYE